MEYCGDDGVGMHAWWCGVTAVSLIGALRTRYNRSHLSQLTEKNSLYV